MREKYLSIELATPNKKVSIGQANSCSAPGALGKFQVLPNHAPMVSELGIGEVKIELPAKTHYYSVSGGFLEVVSNKVLLLLETAEAAEDIDVSRAEKAKIRAQERLEHKDEHINTLRAEAALARALNRLNVAQKASADIAY